MRKTESDVEFARMVRTTAIWTIGVAIVIWGIFGFLPWLLHNDSTKAGAFGDSFGFANSLLSSLALAGAICAIVLQIRELRYQREELQESQETWKSQTEALLLTAYVNNESSPRFDAISDEAVEHRKMLLRSLSAILERKIEDLSDNRSCAAADAFRQWGLTAKGHRSGEQTLRELELFCHEGIFAVQDLRQELCFFTLYRQFAALEQELTDLECEIQAQQAAPAHDREERIRSQYLNIQMRIGMILGKIY